MKKIRILFIVFLLVMLVVPVLGASFKIIDPYRSDLAYNVYQDGELIGILNVTEAYHFNTTNGSVFVLTPVENYFDITDQDNVSNFITGILGFVLFAVFIGMAFRVGRGRGRGR